MAGNEKKSNKWLYIVLVISIGIFLFDSLTSDKSLVKIKKTAVTSLLPTAKKEQGKFNIKKLYEGLNNLKFYENYYKKSQFPQNPFYQPVAVKRKVSKPKPGLVAVIKQIIEGDPPYVEIDDQILTIGDTYKGWKITKIEKDKVYFEKEGQKAILSTRPGMQMR